eukprot:TRINITY_DN9126_c0_g1_i1.p1 TRINITY_DN9126_c0_g1~~TRINITY_DN9126_c0_g1_i1.p1  ORF type:complete len:832 (-),score=129.45 TRINITY_DN9126_c0_g1_i1:76-2571(-)
MRQAMEAQAVIPTDVSSGGKFVAITPDNQRVEITVPRDGRSGDPVTFFYKPLAHAITGSSEVDASPAGGDPGISAPLLKHAISHHHKSSLAAWYFENALEGKDMQASKPLSEENIVAVRKMEHKRRKLRVLFDAAATILVALSFFETPLWCRNWEDLSKFISPEDRCPLPNGADPELSGLPQLPPVYVVSIEVVCLLACLAGLLVHVECNRKLDAMGVSGHRERAAQPEALLVVTIAMMGDVAVYWTVRQSSFRFAPYGRIVLLLYWHRVCAVVRASLRCLTQFVNIVVILVCFCGFTAWVLAMVLQDIKEASDAKDFWTTGTAFDGLSRIASTMFSLMCNNGFPDRVTVALANAKWTPVIFFPYQWVTYFLLTQLLLATVIEAYNSTITSNLKQFIQNRSMGVAKAFLLLADPGSQPGEEIMSIKSFSSLVMKLRENPKLSRRLRGDNAEILFAGLDDNGDGTLTLTEFFDASSILLMLFWVVPSESILQRWFGFRLQAIKALIVSGLLDKIVDIILTANVVFIVIESYFDMRHIQTPSWVFDVETFFSCVYVLDCMLKLCVSSFSNYWSESENKFDFVVSWILFVAGVLTMTPEQRVAHKHTQNIIRYLNILRFVRLIKVFVRIQRFRSLFMCMKNLLKVSFDTLMLVFVVLYLFGNIGMQLTGGLLYQANPLLKDTVYISSGYHITNYNDMLRAVLSQFCLVCNGYIQEVGEVFDLVTGLPPVGFCFCACNYFITVSIVQNIFTAFSINAFLTLRSDAASTDGDNDEDKNLMCMREACSREGKTLHVSIPPEVVRMRVNMKNMGELETVIEECRAVAQRQAAAFHHGA